MVVSHQPWLRPHAEKMLCQFLPEARAEAGIVLNLEAQTMKFFHSLLDRELTARRIRIHGDYPLGQALFAGRDFVLIDFEGEPARTIQERRIKGSPVLGVQQVLRDAA